MISQPAVLKLSPQFRHYVWGGNRLAAGEQPMAEIWAVYAGDVVTGGDFAGQTLAQVTAALGEHLLGAGHTGDFPLLIKLIDAAQWLSLQVHPDDDLARRLEGEGFRGKTEAWHVLDAPPGAELIAGFKKGVSQAQVQAAVGQRAILDLVERPRVNAGDTIYMPPRTIHAIGPGMLLYEIQQSSDLTYRVYDWDRPQVNRRVLHIEKSMAVLCAENECQIQHAPQVHGNFHVQLLQCPYFALDLLGAEGQPAQLSTHRQTFHALTVIAGAFDLIAGGETHHLETYESALVLADCAAYQLVPQGAARALLGRLP